MEMLKCTRCKVEKEASSRFFPLHNKKKNGLDSWCRACRGTYRSETRRGHYRKFNCSDETIKELLSEGVCTICGNDGPNLSIDHDHKANQVRGLLCMNCNIGIGQFKDDPELLEFARIYLLSAKNDPEADGYLNNNKQQIETIPANMELLT